MTDIVERLREGRTDGTALRWRVTDVHLEAAEELARLRSELERVKREAVEAKSGVYTASKTVHAPKWRQMRDEGWPIVSTWIDEAGVGETADFSDLWSRCVDEASGARLVILYREHGEVLKGAFIEAGAALALGTPVFAVGCQEFSFVNHPLVTQFETLDEAIRAARAFVEKHGRDG